MITITKIFKKTNRQLSEIMEPQKGINLDRITSRKIELIKEIESEINEDKIKRLNYKVWFSQFDMIATYLYEHPDKTLIDITNKSVA